MRDKIIKYLLISLACFGIGFGAAVFFLKESVDTGQPTQEQVEIGGEEDIDRHLFESFIIEESKDDITFFDQEGHEIFIIEKD